MDYSNTKKKTLVELPNGRCRVEWKGGHKTFISKWHAEQYILKCNEYKTTLQLNRGIYDNGILEFNEMYGIGEDVLTRVGGHIETYSVDADMDDD